MLVFGISTKRRGSNLLFCNSSLHCRQRTTITQPLDSSQEEVDIPTTTQTNDVPDADADVPLIQMETPGIQTFFMMIIIFYFFYFTDRLQSKVQSLYCGKSCLGA